MIDLYSKSVLTVIAVALSVLAWQQVTAPAVAQMGIGCGDMLSPCYVANRFTNPITVRVAQ